MTLPATRALLAPTEAAPRLAFDEVYAAHVGFVWRVLRALGVPVDQLEDAAQDVFVVVHRRLPEFEGRSAITTWLFAITRKVASRARRRARSTPSAPLVIEPSAGGVDPFAAAARSEAAVTIAAALDRMDEDKRLVFALVELEQLAVPDVAHMLDVNVNTAYSRLRLARAEFAAHVRRTTREP